MYVSSRAENFCDERAFVRRLLWWSERQDLNLRPYDPKSYALPNCATPRCWEKEESNLQILMAPSNRICSPSFAFCLFSHRYPLHSSKISLAQMQVGRAARTLTFLGYGIIAVAISAGAFEEVFMLLLQEQHSGAGSENWTRTFCLEGRRRSLLTIPA